VSTPSVQTQRSQGNFFPGRAVFSVAADLLREAASRKWFLALGMGITSMLLTLSFSLKLDVLDGALAASRLFGHIMSNDIRSVDVALRPVFQAAAYLIFYGGMVFGILACSDFAPSLLSPGRIEHLLSLPVRRWELLMGTFLGVLVLALIAAIYGAGGLVLMLGVKTGSWTIKPIVAALLASVSFAAVYSAMLTSALFVRSAALSAAAGGGLFVLGIIAGYRSQLFRMFEAGWGRDSFKMVTLVLPRISTLADTSAALAGSQPVSGEVLGSLLLGLGAFAMGSLMLGIWRFEQKDF
jgi:Cu-processing system permease protein